MRLTLLGLVLVVCLAVWVPAAGATTTARASRSCGTVGGIRVHAHGVACGTARHVYKVDLAGELPSWWTCSASLGRCYRGESGSDEYLWWRPTL